MSTILVVFPQETVQLRVARRAGDGAAGDSALYDTRVGYDEVDANAKKTPRRVPITSVVSQREINRFVCRRTRARAIPRETVLRTVLQRI